MTLVAFVIISQSEWEPPILSGSHPPILSDSGAPILSGCGTYHMASLFSPLSGTTRIAVCSSSSLLVTAFTKHLATHPTSAPHPKLLRLYQVHSLQLSPINKFSLCFLGKPPQILAQVFLCENSTFG